MAIHKLPNELIRLVGEQVEDVTDLYHLASTATRWNSILGDLIYAQANKQDRLELGFPLSLTLAAISNSFKVFQRLLASIDREFLQSRSIPVGHLAAEEGHPAIEACLHLVYASRPAQRHRYVTLLHLLCGLGREEMVKIALEKLSEGDDGGYTSIRSLRHDTPLFRAAEMNHVGVIELLIAAGADPSERDQAGNHAALDLAIDNGAFAAAEFLIGVGAAVNTCCSEERWISPLTLACWQGNIEFIKILLAVGAGEGDESGDGDVGDALWAIAGDSKLIPVAQTLIEAGAVVGFGHVVKAATYDDMDMVQFFLHNGGRSPPQGFYQSALHGGDFSPRMIKLLLKEQPSLLNAKDHAGLTPLDTVYTKTRYLGCTDLERMSSTALCLIEAGGEVSGIDPDIGMSTLKFAIKHDQNEVVRALLGLESQKKLVSTADEEGTVLHIVCVKKPAESLLVVEWLIQSGIDLSATSGNNSTALHIAALSTDVECVCVLRTLIEAGIDKHATDVADETALHVAVAARNTSAVKYLLHAGLDPSARNIQGDGCLHLVARVCSIELGDFQVNDHIAAVVILSSAVLDCDWGFELEPTTLRNCLEMMRLLEAAGANIFARNTSNLTPRDILYPRGSRLTRELLHIKTLRRQRQKNKKISAFFEGDIKLANNFDLVDLAGFWAAAEVHDDYLAGSWFLDS